MRKTFTVSCNVKVEYVALSVEVVNYMNLLIYQYNYKGKRVLYYLVFIHRLRVFQR